MCKRCPTEQVADPTRTKCTCPRDNYNTSAYGGNAIQCVGDYHMGGLTAIAVGDKCVPCAGLPCVDCSDEVKLSAGWSHGAGSSKWFVFRCPEERACPNSESQRCLAGHKGYLCNVCEDDF
eukprot:COSAG04_NODE_5892_length_1463_cov_1.315249_1_plen_120_part_10